MRVLGVNSAPTTASHVFVQVTNPARRPMRLTKLEYTFAAKGETISAGEVMLHREIPAGAATVVEVPLDAGTTEALEMRGRLTAELDEMVRTFKLNAQIQPH